MRCGSARVVAPGRSNALPLQLGLGHGLLEPRATKKPRWDLPLARGRCWRAALWGRKRGDSGPAGGGVGWGGTATHDVGAERAEGAGAAGEQVAAVEWQEDLDVVLTIALGKEGQGVRLQTATRGHPRDPRSELGVRPQIWTGLGPPSTTNVWTWDLRAQPALWSAAFSSVWGEAGKCLLLGGLGP